ncbi:hypothetical protein D9M69_623290 [compost metagenome]
MRNHQVTNCAAKNDQRLSGNTEAVNRVVEAASNSQAGWWSFPRPSMSSRVPKAMVSTNSRLSFWKCRASRINSRMMTRIVKTPKNTSGRQVNGCPPMKLRIRS